MLVLRRHTVNDTEASLWASTSKVSICLLLSYTTVRRVIPWSSNGDKALSFHQSPSFPLSLKYHSRRLAGLLSGLSLSIFNHDAQYNHQIGTSIHPQTLASCRLFTNWTTPSSSTEDRLTNSWCACTELVVADWFYIPLGKLPIVCVIIILGTTLDTVSSTSDIYS